MSSHTFAKILVHVVFSTKNRVNSIPENHISKLHSYIAGIIYKYGSQAYIVGGVSDHIHIAMSLSRTITIAKIVENIKVGSSKWMKEDDRNIMNFKWQKGYDIFSLGESQLPNLIKYIENQEFHHRQMTYEEELKKICNKYNINNNAN